MAARVLIVDDHPVVRAGLRTFLDLNDDLRVVAEAGSLIEAREQATAHTLDLVLLDLQLPDGNGLSLIPELTAGPGRPRVLVLTSFLDEDQVRAAMRRGASGFLLKHAGPTALLDRLRATLRGEMPLDPRAVQALSTPASDPLGSLTRREREVLRWMGEGLSNKQIGGRMGITEKTVKSHATNLFPKLGVRDRVQAALRARELLP